MPDWPRLLLLLAFQRLWHLAIREEASEILDGSAIYRDRARNDDTGWVQFVERPFVLHFMTHLILN